MELSGIGPRCFVESSTVQDVFRPMARPHQLRWGDWEMGTACDRSSVGVNWFGKDGLCC